VAQEQHHLSSKLQLLGSAPFCAMISQEHVVPRLNMEIQEYLRSDGKLVKDTVQFKESVWQCQALHDN